jgi:outer membrane receptor protein involved in Fe transport
VTEYTKPTINGTVILLRALSGDVFDQSGTATSSTAFADSPAGEPVEIPAPVLGSENQLNPKFGLTWSLKSGTTLRAAAFRTLKRTLISDQTLEPTQVAGFNQFFDDVNATESWVYGVAVDQKFEKKVFGGVEFSGRDLTIPFFRFQPDAPPSAERTDGNEKLFRGYVFSVPRNWLALGAEYEYEDFERNPELFLPYRKLKTHRVPLSARFFHPSGFSAFAAVTLLKQDGEFLGFDEFGEQVYAAEKKDFAVVDAGLRYRLPRRYGFLVVGVNNLTDEESTYQATDPRNLGIRPGRLIYARVVLAFP